MRPIFDSVWDGCSEVRKAADRVLVLAFEHMQVLEKHLLAQFDVGSGFDEFTGKRTVITMWPRPSHILAVHFRDTVIEEFDDAGHQLRVRGIRGDERFLF